MLNLKNKILAKSISLLLAQVFLLTSLAYPESSTNKNISGLYIQAKKLRVPMGFSKIKSQAKKDTETISGADGLVERMLAGFNSKAFEEEGMSRREFLYITAAGAGLAITGAGLYKSGEPSVEEKQEAERLKKPIHAEKYTSRIQFEREKEDFIAARTAENNILSADDARRVRGFLTPARAKTIQFAAKAWRLEPALISGFAYEEEIDKNSKNKVKEGIKEHISKMFGLSDMKNTIGLMNVSASFMKDKAFLDFLYKNKDFIMDQLLDNEADKSKFMEFIEGYKFIRQITEKGHAWNAWLETMYPMLNDLADNVESINILLGAYAMRIKSGEIAARNRRETRLPKISEMREDSNIWLVEDYQEIPAGLQERYSIFNSSYYPPYAYHYFLAVYYTGIKIARERAFAKINAYIMFAKSNVFAAKNTAHFSLRSRDNSLSEKGLTNRFKIGELDYDLLKEGDIQALDDIDILGTIGPEDLGLNLTFTIRGPTELSSASEYLKSRTLILKEAISRSASFHEGDLDEDKPITILLADKYDFIAGDHRDNNIIILNGSDLKKIIEDGREDPIFVEELITSALSEELAHERGAEGDQDTEETLAQECAHKTKSFFKETKYFVGLSRYIDFVERFGKGAKGERGYLDYLKVINRYEDLLRNLRKEWKENPGSFISVSGQEGIDNILEYIRKNPGCFVGYGDMKSIGAMNKALMPKIVDRLIPIMVSATDKILGRSGYGKAFRLGGDEAGLVFSASLTEEEVNNLRLELQAVLAEFIPYYGFVKVTGVTDEDMEIVNEALGTDGITGIYKDRDGFFLVFDYLEKSEDFQMQSVYEANVKLKESNIRIRQDSVPVKIPSPRMNLGIVKSEGIGEDDEALHASFGRYIKHAEYVRNIAQENGMNGATSFILGELDKFIDKKDEPAIPKLTRKEREEITGRYSRLLGAELFFDQIEEYYPAIKKDYLNMVIENMGSAEPGSAFLIRGPPENFYIVVKTKKGRIFLVKDEFLYQPHGEFKANIKRAKEKALKEGKSIEAVLRERWPDILPEWHGFKIINEYIDEDPDRETGNKVILALSKEFYVNIADSITLEGPANFSESDFKDKADYVSKEASSALTGEIGSRGSIKVIMGVVEIEEAELQEIGAGKFIDIVDYLTAMARPSPRFTTDSGNIMRVYDKAEEDLFNVETSEFRSEERRKFQPILYDAYRGPALTEKDLDTYKIKHMEIDRKKLEINNSMRRNL